MSKARTQKSSGRQMPARLPGNRTNGRPSSAGGQGDDGSPAQPIKRGKGRPKGSTVPIERRLQRYKEVDWTLSDAEISKDLDVSREAVRQARNVLFGPPPRDRRLRIPRGARIDPVSGYVKVTQLE